MNEMTSALVTALKAVNQQIPCIIDALAQERLPAGKQREFGGLLVALGDLLKEYAETADEPPIPQCLPWNLPSRQSTIAVHGSALYRADTRPHDEGSSG